MILLDTTVLSYAVGAEHPLREPCRRLLAARAEGRLDATTTVEVIQEFVHVRARHRGRADAAAFARSYLTAMNPLTTGVDDLSRGLDLFESHPELGSFDCLLAAVAINRDATLISADRSFAPVPGIRWIDPSSPAVDRLLAAPPTADAEAGAESPEA